MLTAVKNQWKVTLKSIKYATMKQMENRASFLMNIFFMILNNASFILQWVILYSVKSDVGGYSFNQVLLLWGMASATYGFAHYFFRKAYTLSRTITNGKLDAYLVQPKNVLISAITSEVEPSAIGDLLYGYILLFISGITIPKFFLFTLFVVCGALVQTSIAIILASLSFWIDNSEMIANTGNSLFNIFNTYPDGIFKGVTRLLLFTVIPVAFVTYIPVWVLTTFSLKLTLLIFVVTIVLVSLAFIVFYRGLRRYSSSNLMISKI